MYPINRILSINSIFMPV